MIQFFKEINQRFILVTLTVIYFPIIGLSFLMLQLFRKKDDLEKSYWINESGKTKDLDLQSPY